MNLWRAQGVNGDAGTGVDAGAANAVTGAQPDDHRFMAEALRLAAQAGAAGEVPVGAVVVRQGQVVGRGHNSPISGNDPTAHAEVMALRDAATNLGNYRLGDCTLYTTLEPCAMCAGAIQHARIRRLVFGAHDAKAGAAGSVVDLFANPQLNPHAQVLGGVGAEEGARLLTDFFAERRLSLRDAPVWPLREDALRTPEACFADLHGCPWPTRYVNDLRGLDGLRLAYLDEGPIDAPRTWLCLHGHHAWSYAFRHLMATWLTKGDRVVAPDWVGFGRSDKPKREQWHQPEQHLDILLGLIDRLALHRVVGVVQDSAALVLQHWPAGTPSAHRWVLLNTRPPTPSTALPTPAPIGQVLSPAFKETAQQAPFPDTGHQAGPRAWAKWVTGSFPPSGTRSRLLQPPWEITQAVQTLDQHLALQLWQTLEAQPSLNSHTEQP
jgi:tRNA(adenine34) deaminase